MEKYSSLCGYPQDEPLNGLPTYRVSVNTEVFDHDKCEMVGLVGKMMVVISVDFNVHDWELMTKANQGAIVHLETDWDKERRELKKEKQ
jgi:hypothetical protein